MVTLLLSVIKYYNKCNLRKEWLVLAEVSKLESIHHVWDVTLAGA